MSDSASPYFFFTPSNHWHATNSENALYLYSWTFTKNLFWSDDQKKKGKKNIHTWHEEHGFMANHEENPVRERAPDRCTHGWSHQGGARSSSPLQHRHVAHLHRCCANPIPVNQWVDTWKTMGKPWENHGKTMGKPWENSGMRILISMKSQ